MCILTIDQTLSSIVSCLIDPMGHDITHDCWDDWVICWVRYIEVICWRHETASSTCSCSSSRNTIWSDIDSEAYAGYIRWWHDNLCTCSATSVLSPSRVGWIVWVTLFPSRVIDTISTPSNYITSTFHYYTIIRCSTRIIITIIEGCYANFSIKTSVSRRCGWMRAIISYIRVMENSTVKRICNGGIEYPWTISKRGCFSVPISIFLSGCHMSNSGAWINPPAHWNERVSIKS